MTQRGAPLGGPLRRLLSSSALYALTSVAQQAAGFLLIPFYTRLIPPADYGVLEMLITFFTLAMACVTLGMGSAINKVYHRDCTTPEQRAAVVGTAAAASLPTILSLAAVLLLCAGPASAVLTGSADNAGLLRIAVFANVAYAFFAMVLGGLRAQERVGAYSAASLAQFGVALGLNLAFVVGLRLGVRGVLLGNLCANVAALALGTLLLARGGGLGLDRRLLRPLLVFGIAIVPGMLSGWVIDMSGRWLLRIFRDLDAVALYGVGFKFGMAVHVLVTWPFQLAWPAVAFGISHEPGHERTYARVLTYLVLLLAFVLLGMVAASRSLLPLVVGARYAEACAVVPVVAAAYAFGALQYCVAPGIHVGGRTRDLSLLGVGAAVANVALGLVLVPRFGTAGAAWATAGAYALAFAGALRLSSRAHPVAWEWGRMARVAAAGLAAWAALALVPDATSGWMAAGQVGVLAAFLLVVLTPGFVAHDERRWLAGLLARAVPQPSR